MFSNKCGFKLQACSPLMEKQRKSKTGLFWLVLSHNKFCKASYSTSLSPGNSDFACIPVYYWDCD